MTEVTREQARKFHDGVHVLDGHFDLLMDVEIQRGYGRTKMIETEYLPRFQQGGVHSLVAAVFVEDAFVPEMSLRKALNQISSMHAEAAESPAHIVIAKNLDDLQRARAEQKVSFILSLEGAEPLHNDLSLLRVFYELGVRMMGLVWSRRNFVGDGSFFAPVREGKKGGITDFGVRLIEEAEKLGIVIDVSHLNDEGFWDVMEIAEKPVIASHSNSRTVVPTMRNLTDEQIKAIAEKDGLVGLNAFSMFTAANSADATIERLIDHVDYMKKLVGARYIGIGLDLCDDLTKYLPLDKIAKTEEMPFDVVKGHASLPEITRELMKRRYTDTEIEGILGGNFLRVYQQVWK
ncbi:membrane dipeptidase [Brevibacillus brevis]|uniref:dipeptidase n=1 Tax=Brevibacillus brevis TaxID=1393 RepID=UPI0019000429|nr:dipeptidase [Brevibacillus brevis]MBH0331961.1 membrane dipeptidase [Brevibacillus brevis]